MKLSASNVLQGKVTAIKKGVTTANVKIELGRGVIKASDVIVAK